MAQVLDVIRECKDEFRRWIPLTIKVIDDERGLRVTYEPEDNRRMFFASGRDKIAHEDHQAG